MVEATSKMVKGISEQELLEMKEMEERLSIAMQFYCIISSVVYLWKPEVMPFIACRMVQLAMDNGLSIYSIFGYVQFAMVLSSSNISTKGIESASQIGKADMCCSRKRYNTATQLPNLPCLLWFFSFSH